MTEAAIPLKPIGKEEIHKLEYSLLISSLIEVLTDPKFVEQLRDPKDRLTWIDSIATAAAALARDKAGMTLSEIAEDIGRTETTIKKHLKGETEAGKIVLEAYKRLEKGEIDDTLSVLLGLRKVEGLNEVKERLEKAVKLLEEAASTLKEALKKLG